MKRSDIGLDRGEKRSVTLSVLFRVLGTPVIGVLGLLNTSLVIHQTGSLTFGVVSTVSSVALLFPFSDLGIGATVTTSSAQWARGAISTDHFRRVLLRAFSVLTTVAAVFVVLAFVGFAMSFWDRIFDTTFDSTDSLYISLCVGIFGLTVPMGLGVRVLTGLGRNHIAVLVSVTASVFTLCLTLILTWIGSRGLAFALPSIVGLLAAGILAVASGLVIARRIRPTTTPDSTVMAVPARLLAGSLWMFLVNIGLPIGLQWGRLIVANDADRDQLAAYGLGAQFYGMAWMVVSTAGAALWPVFVARRGDPAESIRLWRRCLVAFTGCGLAVGVVLALGAGPAGRFISGGSVSIALPLACAFGLLVFVQSVHLPTGMLLTTPTELRWQSMCVLAMAAVSVSLALALVPSFGAAGAVVAAVIAIAVAQIGPDLLVARRKVLRRA